ncbi:hypothetical protein B9479_002764 [Cryptococcus floricola]|uniref:Zn(2)-C6 fungal-type domain-containing protein n=1 Tax=Cryptococcus floricola TaxID=2591691 RepID=A0A5D3AYE9_9TREE|nr:hypothetical protein B9479_002764 [Cryptococcus floricola]
MADDGQVKKRRQNVACDACKLRRVRCDLSTLLHFDPLIEPVAGPSTHTPSLADLVRQNPDVECTNCTNKGIKCSTKQILNPPRPKKGGRRIDQAKKIFGGGDDDATGSEREPSLSSGGSGKNVGSLVDPVAPFYIQPNAPPANWAQDLLSTYGLQTDYPTIPLDPLLSSDNGSFTYQASNPSQGAKTSNLHPPMDFLGPPPNSFAVTGANTHVMTPRASGNFDRRPNHASGPDTPIRASSPSFDNIPGRKRRHDAHHNSSTKGARYKVVAKRKDPWHLWAEGESGSVVNWGMTENVQEHLADKTLGVELSRHLVATFFQAVHHFYPSIWPESFRLEWTRAGQRSDRMTSAQEVLCATIEAWGAHYSDSPVILGPPPNEIESHTNAGNPNESRPPEHQIQAYWGQARNDACIALIDRARRIADINGVLRKPTLTGVQSLALLCQLLHASNQPGKVEEIHMEAHMIQVIILEQMKVLGLMWQSDRAIVTDKEELPVSQTELRIKQIRLFWSQTVIDTYWAASYAQPPGISDEEFEAAGNCMALLKGRIPPVSFEGLSLFVSIYYRIAKAGRDVTVKLAIPNRKKGAVDVDQFCSDVRQIWQDVTSTSKDLDRRTASVLRDCRDEDFVGFSPLNYLTHNQLAGPFFPFLIHKIIRDQLVFRKNLASSYTNARQRIRQPDAEAARQWRKAQDDMDKLEALQRDSVDMLLCCCRRLVSVSNILLPTGVMHAASVVLGVLLAGAQVLASVPTYEQGYPADTPGGYGWTWKTKQEAIVCCIKVLNEVGWAWDDAGKLLRETVLPAMEQSARLHQELSINHQASFSQPPPDSAVAQRQLEQDREIQEALDAVMRFWPPVRDPDIAEPHRQANHNDELWSADFSAQSGRIKSSATQRNDKTATESAKRGANAVPSDIWSGSSRQSAAFSSGLGAFYPSTNPSSTLKTPPPALFYNSLAPSESSSGLSSAFYANPMGFSQPAHIPAAPAMGQSNEDLGIHMDIDPSGGLIIKDAEISFRTGEAEDGQELTKFLRDWGMGHSGQTHQDI